MTAPASPVSTTSTFSDWDEETFVQSPVTGIFKEILGDLQAKPEIKLAKRNPGDLTIEDLEYPAMRF